MTGTSPDDGLTARIDTLTKELAPHLDLHRYRLTPQEIRVARADQRLYYREFGSKSPRSKTPLHQRTECRIS